MRETYFVTFRLGALGRSGPTMAEVVPLCRDWAVERRSGVDGERARAITFDETGDHRVGETAQLSVRRHQDEECDLFGFRLEHPDREDSSIRWLVELCAAQTLATHQLRVAVSTSVGRVGPTLSSVDRPSSRPRLVKTLVEKFSAHEDANITERARLLPKSYIEPFTSTLTDPDRRLPVIFVSAARFNDKPIVDADRIADRVVGLAQVYVAADRFTGFALSDAIGSSNSAWDGGVRVYWPGFRPWSTDRTLFLRDDVLRIDRLEGGLDEALLRELSKVAVNRVLEEPARWTEIDRRIADARISQLRARGDDAQLLEAFSKENDQNRAELRRLEIELANSRNVAEACRREAKTWKDSYLELRKSQAPRTQEAAAEDTGPPATVKQALERTMAKYPDRIVLALNSQSDYDNNPFEDAPAAHAAFTFLATTYWTARTGTTPCKDLDLACRTASGFFYRSHQSDVTMGRYINYYQADLGGEKVSLPEHIGYSNSRDARTSIRIGFTFDRSRRQVIIGFIGQHQKTSSS